MSREPEQVRIDDPDLPERYEQMRQETERAWDEWGLPTWARIRDTMGDLSEDVPETGDKA